jgi:hypothetical protein
MNWKKCEQAAKKGPRALFKKVFLPIIGLIVVLSIVGYIFNWFGEAAQVAQEEFGPRAALEKYEWFIDQASRIEKMDQDIVLFENRIANVDSNYSAYGSDKSKWPAHIQVTYNHEKQQSRDDLTAIISQRNNLSRDYNAQSEKFNWAPFKTRLDKPREKFQEYASN